MVKNCGKMDVFDRLNRTTVESCGKMDVVVVFLWWCGGAFVVVWCFCGGVFVGGVFVGGVVVVVFLWCCGVVLE